MNKEISVCRENLNSGQYKLLDSKADNKDMTMNGCGMMNGTETQMLQVLLLSNLNVALASIES